MFYWILSAALLASACAEPCNDRYLFFCPPSINTDFTISNPPTIIIPMPAMPVAPVDDCDDTNSQTRVKNTDSSFDLIGTRTDFIGNSGPKTVPTKTTEASKETTFTTTSSSGNEKWRKFNEDFDAKSTTTTAAAPEIKHKNGMIITTGTLGDVTDSTKFISESKITSEMPPEVLKYIFQHPEHTATLLKYFSEQNNKQITHLPASKNDKTEKPEPCDDETKQIPPKFEVPVPSATTEAPKFNIVSGPHVTGHKYEHKSSKSSESSSSSFTHYTYGNAPGKFEIITNKGPQFGGNIQLSNEFKQTVPKFEVTKKNPCEFNTGIFRFVPCENEVVVKQTRPVTKSFETVSIEGPYEGSYGVPIMSKNTIDCSLDC